MRSFIENQVDYLEDKLFIATILYNECLSFPSKIQPIFLTYLDYIWIFELSILIYIILR